jgi:uncharacterized protein YaiL (DUF2058 family)
MSDMQDALRKAGLVSKKDTRRVAHEKRVRRKKLGQDGLAAEREQKEADYRAEREAQRQADQAAEAERRKAQAADEERERLAALISANDELPRQTGERRFHFVAEEGRIRCVDVSDSMQKRLIQGAAAIVAAAGIVRGGYAILPARAARELARIDPDLILHWNAKS